MNNWSFPHFSFPQWLFPSVTNSAVDVASNFYELAVEVGIMLIVLYAGVAILKLVKGYTEEDMQEVNEARHTLYSSLFIIGGLALTSSFVSIVLNIARLR